jgi:hypothetical protein
MRYTEADVTEATTAMDKYRFGESGAVDAAPAVVELSAERVAQGDRDPRRHDPCSAPRWCVDRGRTGRHNITVASAGLEER